MGKPQDSNDVVGTDTAAGGSGGGVSLGKGAWDCDKNVEIPPEAEVSLNVLRPASNQALRKPELYYCA